jgi:hypothetical protein
LFVPPLMEILFQPFPERHLDEGQQMAPAPIPKLMGNSAISVPVIVANCSALSDFSSVDSAVTWTDSEAVPTAEARPLDGEGLTSPPEAPATYSFRFPW